MTPTKQLSTSSKVSSSAQQSSHLPPSSSSSASNPTNSTRQASTTAVPKLSIATQPSASSPPSSSPSSASPTRVSPTSSQGKEAKVIHVRESPTPSAASTPKVTEAKSSSDISPVISTPLTTKPASPVASKPSTPKSTTSSSRPSTGTKSNSSLQQGNAKKDEKPTADASSEGPDSVAQATLVHDEKDTNQKPKEEVNEEPPMTMEAINYLLTMGVKVSDVQIARAKCAASNDSLLTDNRMTVFAVLEGIQMTVAYKVIVPRRYLDVVGPIVTSTFDDVNKTINTWNPNSEISAFNGCPRATPFTMSDMLRDFLVLTERLVLITNGRFDPTISPIFKLWKASLAAGAPPTSEARAETNKIVGWAKHIKIDGNKITKLEHSDACLDVGAIAKGYCVDLLIERINAAGVEDVYVDWGSDIRATGIHPEGRPWRTAILKPPAVKDLFEMWKKKKNSGPGDFIDELKLAGGLALATSGDYMQVQKFGYHHIVRPSTGCMFKANNTGISSASALATNCTVSDAIATACLTFETCGECHEWLQQVHDRIPSLLAYWIYARNEDKFVWKRKQTTNLYPLLPFTDKTEAFKSVMKSSFIHAAAIMLVKSKGKTFASRVAFESCSLNPPMISLLLSKSGILESQMMQLLSELPNDGSTLVSVNIVLKEQASLFKQIVTCVSAGDFSKVTGDSLLGTSPQKGAPILPGSYAQVVCSLKSSVSVESGAVGMYICSVEEILRDQTISHPAPLFTFAHSQAVYEMEDSEDQPSATDEDGTLVGSLRGVMRLLGGNVSVVVTQCIRGNDYTSDPLGVSASSVRIANLDPPLVYVSVMRNSAMFKYLCSNPSDRVIFSIHVLHQNQKQAAQTFASNARPFNIMRKTMNFTSDWFYSTWDFSDSLISLTCQAVAIESAGDHSVVLARVVDVKQPNTSRLEPIIYSKQSYTNKLRKVAS
eukprot:TRINITY_DN1811_c0_g2_i1.p1 TRINITY_DN1811_c0_g2~~TRINITY_DN1811_c0_g2_i1.p1  ORF type:complete len:1059 (-),score=217.23 TRINITY_DN1811_c0_g2_i1:169-2994(-)